MWCNCTINYNHHFFNVNGKHFRFINYIMTLQKFFLNTLTCWMIFVWEAVVLVYTIKANHCWAPPLFFPFFTFIMMDFASIYSHFKIESVETIRIKTCILLQIGDPFQYPNINLTFFISSLSQKFLLSHKVSSWFPSSQLIESIILFVCSTFYFLMATKNFYPRFVFEIYFMMSTDYDNTLL